MAEEATRAESESDLSSSSPTDSPEEKHDIEKIATQTSRHSKTGTPATKIQTAQDWTGPDDEGNPLNWPLWLRIYHTIIPALFCFTMYVHHSSRHGHA